MTSSIALSGLNGGNPLAFLASLGTLRCCHALWPGCTMAWQEASGWQPVLQLPTAMSQKAMLQELHSHVQTTRSRAAWQIGDNTKMEPAPFRDACRQAQTQCWSQQEREDADWLIAFGCESTLDQDGSIQDTALRTMAGAGHQHFIGFMRGLAENTSLEQLENALFGPWHYEVLGKALSMRWDPADDRHYALRWQNPSSDKINTVRGANRLAVEAIPLLPTQPVRSRLHTTGFNGTVWRWPIWEQHIGIHELRSLLALAEVQNGDHGMARQRCRARGILELFQSNRITRGKFRNFTPAAPVAAAHPSP